MAGKATEGGDNPGATGRTPRTQKGPTNQSAEDAAHRADVCRIAKEMNYVDTTQYWPQWKLGQGKGPNLCKVCGIKCQGKKPLNASRKSEYKHDPSWLHCAGTGDRGCEGELQLRVDMEDTYQSTHVLKERLPKLTSQVMANIFEEPNRSYPYNGFVTEIEVVRLACDNFLKAAEGRRAPETEKGD